MCTEDFIIDLFVQADTKMAAVARHPQAALWPGEVVTLAMLFALKGVGQRPYDRWVRDNWRHLFPRLPDRTRLFRLFAAHRGWTARFLARASLFGIADTYGIELLNTRQLDRSDRQIAKRGKCAGRWIAGIKFGLVVNCRGRVCRWAADTANVYDADGFAPLVAAYAGRMIVLADSDLHKSPYHRKDPQDRDPPNLTICPRGHWGERHLIETVLSMLTRVCRLKHLTERAWRYLRAHLAFVVALFNVLTCWRGRTKLAIAQFSP